VSAIAIGIFIASLLWVCSDILLFWYDYNANDVVQRVKDRAEKGPGIYENVPQGLWEPTGLRLRRLNKEVHHDAISGKNVLIETNALGYRSPHIAPKQEGETRVLVLGDSITLAAYCDYKDTYPAIMEDNLGCRVINAGISGNSLNESLTLLIETGLLVQPDIVVVGMYLNDAAPSPTYKPLDGVAGNSILLQRAYKASRYKQFEKNAKLWYEELSGNEFPEPTPKDAWRTSKKAFEYEKAKACWDWGRAWYPWAWEQLSIDMEQFNDLSQQYHFQLVFLLFPCTLQVEADFLDDTPQRYWKEIVEKMGVSHLDLLPILRDNYQSRRRSLAYDYCHLTPEGNRLVAEAIADLLKNKVLCE